MLTVNICRRGVTMRFFRVAMCLVRPEHDIWKAGCVMQRRTFCY